QKESPPHCTRVTTGAALAERLEDKAELEATRPLTPMAVRPKCRTRTVAAHENAMARCAPSNARSESLHFKKRAIPWRLETGLIGVPRTSAVLPSHAPSIQASGSACRQRYSSGASPLHRLRSART